MEGEVIDEARLVWMPESELLDHSAGITEERSCANDKFDLRKLTKYYLVVVCRLDEQGDSGRQRAVTTSQPFPNFRH